MSLSHVLDVLESSDEDVHQRHLRPPAGTPCQSTQQIVVYLLGGVVVKFLQGYIMSEKDMGGQIVGDRSRSSQSRSSVGQQKGAGW